MSLKRTTGSFRNTQWDPILLITQIISIQALLYFSLGGIMFIMDNLAAANHTLDHLFQYHVNYYLIKEFHLLINIDFII